MRRINPENNHNYKIMFLCNSSPFEFSVVCEFCGNRVFGILHHLYSLSSACFQLLPSRSKPSHWYKKSHLLCHVGFVSSFSCHQYCNIQRIVFMVQSNLFLEEVPLFCDNLAYFAGYSLKEMLAIPLLHLPNYLRSSIKPESYSLYTNYLMLFKVI